MRRIVLFFGAGASFGAGGILPGSPPLGFQLYGELAQSYPGSWGRLPPHIQSAIGADFEAGMRLIYDELGGAIPQLMREMAIYFIQFRPVRHGSLYRRLVDVIVQNRLSQQVVLSSLNYECVLDFAVAQANLPIAYFQDEPGAVPLFKLHGSCNMFAEGLSAGPGVLYGTGVTWDSGIRALPSPDDVIRHCLVETGLAPVMSLYMEGKPLNVAPSVIAGLQQRWAKAVNAADCIISIGVRPLPADDHIWTPLRETPGHLYFVGDRIAFDDWRAGRTRPTTFLASRFDAAFDQIAEVLKSHVNE